ncbi:MAG: hypothetical protein J3R72DRAFT_484717 [Linnemannia gamsii]|nr:MAG: hypothetical protein J3R72DRAFT_484717 [Linnemannia gamsii]
MRGQLYVLLVLASLVYRQQDVTKRDVSAILTDQLCQNWTSLDSYERDDARFYKFVRLIEMPDAVRPVTKWNLPKLKSLELLEAPALQSNYDSLETMRCQEELTLVIRRRTDLEDQLQGIPRLSTYTNPYFAHLARRQSVVVDTDVSINDTFTKFQISQSRITEHGLVASMTHQRLPLVAFTPATPNIPLSAVEESLTTGGPTLDVSNRIGDNVVWGISMNPESFMESKLERLTLSGPCVIAAPDLVVLYRNHDHIEGNKVLVDGSVAEIENEVSYSTGTITENATTTTAAKDKQVIGTPYLKAPSLSRPLPLPPMTNMQRPLSGRSLVEVSSSFNVALKEA